MSKRSIYNATYGKIYEMSGLDRSDINIQKMTDAAQDVFDREEEPGEYVDGFNEEDLELSADAQEIAQMAAEQHSNGNIDELGYVLGHDAYFKDGKESASTGEVLITDIKSALENNEINKTDLFRRYENGESIVTDIDFMKKLKV